MKNHCRTQSVTSFCLCAFVILIMIGCGAKKDALKHDGLTMKYSMKEGDVLKYRLMEEFSQELEIGGTPMVISADEMRVMSIRPKKKGNDQYRLGVTIDSMTASVVSPQGTFSPDLAGMHGKTCEFNVTDLGKETDVMNGEPIEYEIYPGQKQNAASLFQAFFPDLPNRPVRIGDTWPSIDTVFDKNDKGEMIIVFRSTNKFDGYETVDGTRCARVLVDVTGELDGVSHDGGTTLVSKLTIVGSETWYFDYEHGVFVKSISSGIGEGTVVGSGPQEVNIPLKREFSYVTEKIE